MVKLIVAISENRVIGKDNDLIWHLPADMKFFSDQTKGHIVLMGRRNWHSIPDKYRPLPKRLNVVVTRDTCFDEVGCDVYHSVEKGIEAYNTEKQVSIRETGSERAVTDSQEYIILTLSFNILHTI